MKHYLVMCKDEQWLNYLSTMFGSSIASKIYTMEVRQNSFILHDKNNPDNSFTYIKVTPDTVDSFIPSYLLFKEQIWLCSKEEFV